MKVFTTAFLMILSTCVFSGAQTSFSHTGIISEESGHSETILVNNKAYRIDNDTNVHALVRPGELAPRLPAGELIGFNISQDEVSELHYITDIWLLNAN